MVLPLGRDDVEEIFVKLMGKLLKLLMDPHRQPIWPILNTDKGGLDTYVSKSSLYRWVSWELL